MYNCIENCQVLPYNLIILLINYYDKREEEDTY